MQKVTVKDIAEALNLSIGTVYRSLNNTGRVSEKTKQQVLAYAEQVGFQPNAVAQGLAKRKKYRIDVLFGGISEWWDLVRSGAEKAAQELSEFGAEITFINGSPNPPIDDISLEALPIGLIERIEQNKVDGIILVPSANREIMASLDLAKQKGIPVICVNADTPLASQRLCYYGPDEERVGNIAGELMGKFLNGKGNVFLIGAESNDFYRLALRKKGFFDQLCRYFPDVSIIRQRSFPFRNFQEYLLDTLQDCGNDLAGIYVYEASVLEDTAKIVKQLNLSNIVVIGHECLPGCEKYIQEGWIHATLCQETFSQGYYPLKLMYSYLLSGTQPDPLYYCNVNAVFRSNLDLLETNECGCGFR